MAEPDIDDFVEEAVGKVIEVAVRAAYHGDKLQSFIDILTDRLIDVPYNLDHD